MSNNKLLQKWVDILGLNDWTISLCDNCTPQEMDSVNSAGQCIYNEVQKCAVINIINPECYGEKIIPFDYEKTLVHELMHIKLCFLQESGNDLQERIVHQLVESMARALVKANREKKELNGKFTKQD